MAVGIGLLAAVSVVLGVKRKGETFFACHEQQHSDSLTKLGFISDQN
jgi:hypothetical protein